MNERQMARRLFLLLLALYLLSTSLRIDSGDGETMYRVAFSLVSGQGCAIPVDVLEQDTFDARGRPIPVEVFEGGDGYGLWGRDARYYAKYGLGWSLAAAPFCALGRVIAPLVPGATEGFVTRAAVTLLNTLAVAATAALLFRLSCRVAYVRAAAALAILYGLGTIAWSYARGAFSQPLEGLMLLQAVWLVERTEEEPHWWRWVAVGTCLGAGILVRQMSVLAAVPIIVWALRRVWGMCRLRVRWARYVAALLVPLALGQMAALGYNWFRFGNLLETGYRGVTWDTPLWEGLYGLLFSPGKGLFIFAPVCVLGVAGWPRLRHLRADLAWMSLAVFSGYLVAHAIYGDWTGGAGWGPRYLVTVIPFALLPAAEMLQVAGGHRLVRLALVAVVTVSLLVQILGISVTWVRHAQRVLDSSATSRVYYWRSAFCWADAPILGQVRSLLEVLALVRDPASRADLAALVGPERETSTRDWQSEAVGLLSFNVPDFWFVYLWFLGLPAGWLAGVAVILSGVAAGAALQLRRGLGGD